MDFGANHLSLQQFMAADEPAAIADVPAADPLDEEIAIEPAPDEYDVPDYPDADNYDVPDEPPPAPPPPQAAKDRPKIGKLF